jgi:hypothetical protein
MCKPYTHIMIVQIMIDNAKLHSIIIYKRGMNLKLYALTFKVGKCITSAFLKCFFIDIKFDYNINILPKLFTMKNSFT